MKAIKIHLVSRQFRKLRALLALFRLRFDERETLRTAVDTEFGTPLSSLRDLCRDMRLNIGAMRAERLLDGVLPTFIDKALAADSECVYRGSWNFLEKYIEELEAIIEDELSLRAYFDLDPNQAALYESASPFGAEVVAAFPSAAPDIEEAAKCIALDRGTAGVFHLMRVMELGLRSLGKSLNNPKLDPLCNPSWESILKKCDDELKLPLEDRSPEWRKDDGFYSEATGNLRAVKNAWRNPTLHIDRSYDPERSLDILQAVKGFMRHLAERLSE